MVHPSRDPALVQEVELNPSEMLVASSVGCMRHIAAVKAGRHDKHGAASGGWQIHIEGALGELAVAKCLGRFWSGAINTFKDADIGTRIQVRTRSRHDYDLIVREDDGDSDLFVLVTGVAPSYRVKGWLSGKEAKNPAWLASHGNREPAFFVPASALRPIESIGDQ